MYLPYSLQELNSAPQVCDEPHPLLVRTMLDNCVTGNVDESYKTMNHLWKLGYSSEDIITNVFRVCKNHNEMAEFIKLEFIKEIGFCHMRIVEGCGSLLQVRDSFFYPKNQITLLYGIIN